MHTGPHGARSVAGDDVDARHRLEALEDRVVLLSRVDVRAGVVAARADSFVATSGDRDREQRAARRPRGAHVCGSTVRIRSSWSCSGPALLGASVIRSVPFCVLGNGITSRKLSAPGQEHRQAVHPNRDPPVRRRAEAERVEEEAELRPRLLVRDPERAEDLRLHRGVVEADRPAADLEPVQDQVVPVAEDLARVRLEQLHAIVVRAREGVVRRDPRLSLVVVLEERRVHDPEEVELPPVPALRNEPQPSSRGGSAGLPSPSGRRSPCRTGRGADRRRWRRSWR